MRDEESAGRWRQLAEGLESFSIEPREVGTSDRVKQVRTLLRSLTRPDRRHAKLCNAFDLAIMLLT